jgi:hypothetical protein
MKIPYIWISMPTEAYLQYVMSKQKNRPKIATSEGC